MIFCSSNKAFCAYRKPWLDFSYGNLPYPGPKGLESEVGWTFKATCPAAKQQRVRFYVVYYI